MCPPSRSESNSLISFRGAVGARLLKFSNRFTAYSSDPIDLKFGMVILDINLHNRYEQDFLGAREGSRIPKVLAYVICTYMFLCLAVADIFISSI